MKKSRLLLWLMVIGLCLTGFALYGLEPADPDDFPHPLTNLFRQLHGWLAALFLIMLGFMINDHMQKKWRRHLRRIEGSIHLTIWMLLMITGWLIYYPPEFIPFEWLEWSHLLLGVAAFLLFPLHALRKLNK